MSQADSIEDLSNEELNEYISEVAESFRCTEGLDKSRPVEVVAYAAIQYAMEYALRNGTKLEDAASLLTEIVGEYSSEFDASVFFNSSDEVH